jgi:hypothetical protein
VSDRPERVREVSRPDLLVVGSRAQSGSGVSQRTATVTLAWIPLGAGQRIVRASGATFELLSALVQRRQRCALYHSALIVDLPDGQVVIEMAPIVDGDGARRGVAIEGAVGSRLLRRFRLFRYEVRCWSGGVIPDAGAAAATIHQTVDVATAQLLVDLVPSLPAATWGRDELGAGEMWNSNSVTAWLLVRSGIDVTGFDLPAGGRAPGWDAGAFVARRDLLSI